MARRLNAHGCGLFTYMRPITCIYMCATIYVRIPSCTCVPSSYHFSERHDSGDASLFEQNRNVLWVKPTYYRSSGKRTQGYQGGVQWLYVLSYLGLRGALSSQFPSHIMTCLVFFRSVFFVPFFRFFLTKAK